MMDVPRGYVELEFGQRELSFLLKKYNPPKNRYSKCWSNARVKKEVLESPRLHALLTQLANDEERELSEYWTIVEDMVDEIGHKMNLASVKTLATLIRRPLHRVTKGIFIQEKGLEELRSMITQWPVVLLPSHRSYLDFLLVSYFMLQFDIQIPAIAAGQDFLGMQFISALLRRSGAFFLRRTFGTDRLYKLVFTLYTQAILCGGDTPMEFFIEGTRSRVGKCLHPKLGLLSMIVEPYLNGAVPDIMLFPLSISYEKTFEEDLFARELLGIPKPKESTSGLMKAYSLLSNDYGRIFINISSPISLHELCQQWGISRISHGLYPRDVFSLTSNEREMVTKLGYHVLQRINDGFKVFPSAILSAVLLQYPLGIDKEGLVRQALWLKREVELRGAQVEWGEGDPHSVIDGSLRLLGYEAPEEKLVKPINTSKDCSELSKQGIMDRAFLYLKLAHYRNQLVYWFLPESLCLMCLVERNELPLTTLKRLFLNTCTALAKEFVLPQVSLEQLFHGVLVVLTDRGLVSKRRQSETTYVRIGSSLEHHEAAGFIGKIIRPFVAGAWVLCRYLHSLKGGVQTLKSTYKNAQMLAVEMLSKGVLDTFECLSLDILKNAMASLNSAGLILHLDLEFEGRGRLVKVDNVDEFNQLMIDLEFVLFPQDKRIIPLQQSKL